MDGLEIRLAREDEYPAVGELTVEANLADRLVRDEYLPELRDAAARAHAGELLVALDSTTGELVGTASLFVAGAGPRWAEGAEEADAVLRMLAVASKARRRGIGRALAEECISRARGLGCQRLVLSTGVWMTAARSLYEELGFERAPGADWEPLPGVALLAYRLAL